MSRIAQAAGFVRNNGLTILREGGINIVLPYLIYAYAQPHYGDVNALIASSAPPIVWSIVEFARHRRVDFLSVFVLLGIVLSLLAFVGGGGVKFLQLREKLVTVIFSFIFLGSAAIGRPIIYELARAGMKRSRQTEELARFEKLRESAAFRRTMTTMTLVWGFGLLADAIASIALVYTLSIKEYLVVSPVMGYAVTGSLALWTFWYGRKRRREGEAFRAAQMHSAG
ncbi:MAG TPA: VC0807 family protein [Rhizomicrobium sp.]